MSAFHAFCVCVRVCVSVCVCVRVRKRGIAGSAMWRIFVETMDPRYAALSSWSSGGVTICH